MTRDEAIAQVAAALRVKRQADVEQVTTLARAVGTFTPAADPDFMAQAARLIDDQAATLALDTVIAGILPNG